MSEHHKINYVEIPAKDIKATQSFFGNVFDWQFIDYGPEYCSIENASVDGGFYLSDKVASTENGSVLIVLYSDDLEASMQKIVTHGGHISKSIFSFPGGSRFHFNDTNGNEFAVWRKN